VGIFETVQDLEHDADGFIDRESSASLTHQHVYTAAVTEFESKEKRTVGTAGIT
jgi:hypothetical protein